MTRLLLTTALALVLATSARAEDLWTHNGSLMGVGQDRTVFYVEPRPGLPADPGAVLFQGDADNVNGTAFGFSPGCPPTPYRVKIVRPGPDTLVLEGPAPIIDAVSCRVLELTWATPSARLLFVRVDGGKR